MIHHDTRLPLLLYVDSSVEGGYAVAVHQVPKHAMKKESLSIEDILNGRHDHKLERPITYLSKQLNKHEVHYWPTELEIAGIVWSVQKLRHLIEGSDYVKVFTDHKAAEDILASKTLKTSSSVRQNLRLIRASQFMSQYPMVKVIYRPGKDNVNADALSRLTQLRSSQTDPKEDEGGVYGFLMTVVGISMSTLRLLEDGYIKDQHLSLIYNNIKRKMQIRDTLPDETIDDTAIVPYNKFTKLDKLSPDEIEYNGFQGRILHNHILLYIVDPIDNHPRLCIPSNCHKLFFEAAHDKNSHSGFKKAYNELRQNYYIKNLSRSLRSYISSCPSCQQNATLRHKPHGSLS